MRPLLRILGNPWTWLDFSLVLNLVNHLTDRPTLCSSARPHVPAWAFDLAWLGLSAWIRPHYRRGFRT